MTVSLLNNNSGTTNSTTGSVTGNTASETSDMFTKLLVAQIQNQDPLSPTDPAQFVQQLTQLSQTEALQNLSTLTSANSSVLQSMQVLALGAQVGSDVMAETSTVTLDGKTAVSGQTTLPDQHQHQDGADRHRRRQARRRARHAQRPARCRSPSTRPRWA
jgi:flagellar basal-body rod modification protein FlgD